MKRKFTQEHRHKLSLAHKGKVTWNKGLKNPILIERNKSEKQRKAVSIAMTGKKKSKKSILKGLKTKRNLGYNWINEDYRKKMSEKFKGRIFNKKWRKKISKGRIKYWDKVGRKLYEKPPHSGTDYIKWRTKIHIRDNFTCQNCNKTGEDIQVHHIKSWTKYPKLRFVISNGITLCESCHKLTDSYACK